MTTPDDWRFFEKIKKEEDELDKIPGSLRSDEDEYNNLSDINDNLERVELVIKKYKLEEEWEPVVIEGSYVSVDLDNTDKLPENFFELLDKFLPAWKSMSVHKSKSDKGLHVLIRNSIEIKDTTSRIKIQRNLGSDPKREDWNAWNSRSNYYAGTVPDPNPIILIMRKDRMKSQLLFRVNDKLNKGEKVGL